MRHAAFKRVSLLVCALFLCSDALAHSFGQNYLLPVPIWLYMYGAGAALLLSFLVLGYFVGNTAAVPCFAQLELHTHSPGLALLRRVTRAILRGFMVGAWLLCIIAGFIGSNNEYRNINMTLFWVWFVLGFTYLTAILGDLWATISPLKVISDWAEKIVPACRDGLFSYPQHLQHWPALIVYMMFIAIELFGGASPALLGKCLLVYTLLSLTGCVLFGQRDWFERAEFFSVFFGIVAKIAPLDYRPGGPLRLRWPFTGLLQAQLPSFSLLLFILFMLSSTAFDGIKNTLPWVQFFWQDINDWLLKPLIEGPFSKTYPLMVKIFFGYQILCLLLSPLLYFAVYMVFLKVAQRCAASSLSLGILAKQFAWSLLPIAFVYHFTHYFTLLLTQGAQLLRLISDPFSLGWDLFGTAKLNINVIPDMNIIWHSQVLLIVFGHIVSVYLAHVESMRVFESRRSAVLSQIPMLFLMVAFTAFGLWILALPAQSGAPTGL